jgi:serine/threonine protein phosphatase PrpC
MGWFIDADRALGSSHATSNQACQDHITHLSTPNKSWNSICVSDGAGSAKYSEVSSKYVSENFCRLLIELSYEIENRGPGSWINDQIISNVLSIRSGLKGLTTSFELDDYHCTLVALLIGKNVSIAIQIGDGAIIAGKSIAASKGCSSINGKIYTSLPENGEYKNETYFITEPHWLKHLRIKVFGEIDWFVLGSDGGIDVLCDREKLNGKLVSELIKNMSETGRQTSTVTELITSDFAARKTSDDISCAMGFFRNNFVGVDVAWDTHLGSEVHLYPGDVAQTAALTGASIFLPASVKTSEPIAISSSKNLSLGVYRASIITALISFLMGGVFFNFLQDRIVNLYFQIEASALRVIPQFEKDNDEVGLQVDQPEVNMAPKLDQPEPEFERFPMFGPS